MEEIERDFAKVMKEKEDEIYLKMKAEEIAKSKNESKVRILNDLQNKINGIKSGNANALKEAYDKYNVKYKSEYDPHKDEERIISVEDE